MKKAVITFLILTLATVGCKKNTVMYIRASEGVQLKKDNETKARAIATIPDGAAVTVVHVDTLKKRSRVRFNEKEGWVSNEFLITEEEHEKRMEGLTAMCREKNGRMSGAKCILPCNGHALLGLCWSTLHPAKSLFEAGGEKAFIYCRKKGMRLPTRREAIALFKTRASWLNHCYRGSCYLYTMARCGEGLFYIAYNEGGIGASCEHYTDTDGGSVSTTGQIICVSPAE